MSLLAKAQKKWPSLLVIFGAMFVSQPAWAGCWRTPAGDIVETAAGSTPPISGAKKVECPTNRVAIKRKVKPAPTERPPTAILPAAGTSNQRADGRQCVAYVRSKASLPPGIAFERPDAEHLAWKKALITTSAISKGAVAITGGHPAGHMSIVEGFGEVNGVFWITVSETNWKRGYFHHRTVHGKSLSDAEQKLQILGYRN
jgi:hypothetical protein